MRDGLGIGNKCSQLRRQIADGYQLFKGGEAMCELVEGQLRATDESKEGPAGGDESTLSRLLTTSLVCFVRDEPGALLAMTHAVTEHSLSIVDVTSKVASPRERGAAAERGEVAPVGAFQFCVQVASLEQLRRLKAALRGLSCVLAVRRDSMELMIEDTNGDAAEFWRRGVLKDWRRGL